MEQAEASLTCRMYAMVSKVLRERFAEYFARQVMDANSDFGPQLEAYPWNTKK
jgi:hypothetical protein